MASTSDNVVKAEVATDGGDTLSDYIPGSTELSRDPSRAVTASASGSARVSPRPASEQPDDNDDEEEEEEDDDDDDGIDVPEEGESDDEGAKPSTSRRASTSRDGDVVMADVKKGKRSSEQRLQKLAAKRSLANKLEDGKKAQATYKSADSIKRFSYLLGQTDLFRHFCDLKAQRDPVFANMLAESEKLRQSGDGKGPGKRNKGARGRKTEKQEDEELMAETKADDGHDESGDGPFVFTQSPAYVKGGEMREYQVQGLNWMVGLHHNGINGILADEMGLGKTLQTISFLGYLKHIRDIPGPHLVIVPKSTVDNWAREFAKWVPSFNIAILKGTKEERAETIQKRVLPQSFDVLLTTYEVCLREKSALKKLAWHYIVIDEAHRIKNVNSALSQIVRVFDSRARLLITGTPLQNDLHELWSLLNFLLPDVFSDVADFDAWFEQRRGGDGDGDEGGDASSNVVKQLHAVLRPFLLRRVKADVEKSLLPKKEINIYVGMSELQRKWYKMILEKDIDAVNGVSSKREGKTRLQNIVMQLRKCCNHPYLFDGAEPGPPFTTDEHLVEAAGKLMVLDKLLRAMKERGSRVLIFSQMSRLLDILEDYCLFREYKYCRLDGQTGHEERMDAIDAYNRPDSDKFVFLLTTRAGGLGINLTSADVVVLYDSDWNPQADLQAMDRAHRIGQTKQVYVYRFVTENAVEEKVLERAAQKLRLDQLVIQQGRQQQKQSATSKDDLVDMIQHGAERIINSKESMIVSDDIDKIIRRGEERTAELQSKYSSLSFDDLQGFKSEGGGVATWEGEDYAAARKKLGIAWIEPSKRERKSNYSVDSYYRSTLHPDRKSAPRAPRGTKQVVAHDFQFLPPRLVELMEKERQYTRKTVNFQEPAPEDPSLTPGQAEEERAAKQKLIDEAEPLTEDEEKEKEALESEGFADWTRRDFQGFIRGCEAHARDDYDSIQREIPHKTVEEVKAYAQVFWSRFKELDDWERQIKKIEDAEARRERDGRQTMWIRAKVESVKYPLQLLKIPYANQTKGKTYSEEEDRFLLVMLAKYGVGADDTYERIRHDILEFPAFRFDWWFKSRSAIEIGRRCSTLVSLIDKEYGDEDTKKRRGGGGGATNGVAKGKRKADEMSQAGGSSRGSTPMATGGAGGVAAKKARKSVA